MIRSHTVRRAAAVLMSVLVLQAGGLPYFSYAAVAASDDPKVAVLPVSIGDAVPAKAAARFQELLSDELKGRDGIRVVDGPKAGAKAPPPAASKISRTPPPSALEALEEGQSALTELKFDEASEALKRGVEEMTAQPAGIDFEKLVEAYISLAVASFRQGDEEGAQKSLLSVVRLSPDYRLPEGKYPPIFVREFEKARRRTEKAIKGTISIEGPTGATAFVDGRDIGMLPAQEAGLISGTHYVKVEGTRGELFGQAVEVKNGVSKVKAQLQSAGDGAVAQAPGVIGPVLDNAAVSATAKSLDALGADFGVVSTLYRSGDHQITAATAVFSARAHGFATMKTYTFDEELLTANVEAYKLADDISDAMGQFPRAASLPVNLAEGATYKASATASARVQDVDINTGGRRTALTQSKDRPVASEEEETPQPIAVAKDPDENETGANAVRAISGGSMSGELARRVDDDRPASEAKGGVPWWVWAAVGVGVVGAAGGTYYGISQASRPVTGTVTARW